MRQRANSGSNTVPSSQPSDAASVTQPMMESAQSAELATARASGHRVPAPGTAGRYAGIEPHPTFQVGGDLRLAVFVPVSDEDERKTAFFPMQTDLYLAYRPYNPSALNEGRVTLIVSGGALGSKDEGFDEFHERFFVKEWFAMYHDLPYQFYGRLGRFLPAHGWKTDDHTGFTRQMQTILGQPFDHQRQVTGLEVGINPNYAYGHLSVFNQADEWDRPIDSDCGSGAAIAGGWRDLGWHAGGSVIYGRRGTNEADQCGAVNETPGWSQLAASAQWAVNIHHYFSGQVPLVYLGEYHVNHTDREDRDAAQLGLSAFHELGWLVMQGLNVTARYDWLDSDIDYRFDTMHRLNLGFEWYPVPYLEVITRFRHNWTNTEDRFALTGDELLFMLHGWY